MRKIYLVRHGETNDNAAGIVQGGTAVLSPKGQAQATVVAERLRHLSFQHLLVSDYVRTRETIAPLLPYLTITPEYSHLVRETKRPSSCVGQSNKGADFTAYNEAADQHLADATWHFEDEENFYDIVSRVQEFFAWVEEREGDVLVVSHGRFIIYVVMMVLCDMKLTPETWLACRYGFETANTGITVLRYSDTHESWKLTTFNDQAHFAE